MQISWSIAVLRDKGHECFRSVKAKHGTAAGLGIETVREARFHAGALIQKWQWPDMGRQIGREALAVLHGLDFHAD